MSKLRLSSRMLFNIGEPISTFFANFLDNVLNKIHNSSSTLKQKVDSFMALTPKIAVCFEMIHTVLGNKITLDERGLAGFEAYLTQEDVFCFKYGMMDRCDDFTSARIMSMKSIDPSIARTRKKDYTDHLATMDLESRALNGTKLYFYPCKAQHVQLKGSGGNAISKIRYENKKAAKEDIIAFLKEMKLKYNAEIIDTIDVDILYKECRLYVMRNVNRYGNKPLSIEVAKNTYMVKKKVLKNAQGEKLTKEQRKQVMESTKKVAKSMGFNQEELDDELGDEDEEIEGEEGAESGEDQILEDELEEDDQYVNEEMDVEKSENKKTKSTPKKK